MDRAGYLSMSQILKIGKEPVSGQIGGMCYTRHSTLHTPIGVCTLISLSFSQRGDTPNLLGETGLAK